MNTNELKDAIKALSLQDLASLIRERFEEKASQNEGISVEWQLKAFIGQLDKRYVIKD